MTDKLLEALTKGLDWIAENLQQFAISEQFNLSSPNLKDKVAQLKPISELAITFWLLQRSEIFHELSEYVFRWIWEQTQQGKILTNLLMARNDFLPCCSLYASLIQQGYRASHLDEVVTYLGSTDMAGALPLSPWSALALDYNLRLLGVVPKSSPRFDSLYIASFPEPWVISGEIAYSITHEIFYLTDFGFQSLGNGELHRYLEIWIPYWAEIFVSQSDYDLAGEFAMSWRCIRPTAPESAQCLIKLVLAQSDAGYVEGPEGAGSILYQKTDSEARRVFLRRYHTTLVAIMAYALELRAQKAPLVHSSKLS